MKRKDKVEFRNDCMALYKSLTPHLWMRWTKKGYSTLELRMELAKWMLKYSVDKYQESINKRIRTKNSRKEKKEQNKMRDWLNTTVDCNVGDTKKDEIMEL